MRTIRLKSNTLGDTIVEVMISIAVISLVIAGSYSLSGHALQEGISATERSQAVKLAQGQVEALKSRQKDTLTDLTTWNSQFSPASVYPNSGAASINNMCLDPSAANQADPKWAPIQNGIAHNATFDGTSLQAAAIPGANQYNTKCTNNGNTSSAKFFMNIAITTYSDHKNPSYLITVRWQGIGSEPQNATQLWYRF